MRGQDTLPSSRDGQRLAWWRHAAGAALLVSLALIVLSTYSLAREIGRPFGGYVTYGFTANRPGSVAAETPSWWPVFAQGVLAAGDELERIDGLPYYANARRVYAEAAAEGRAVTLTVVDPRTGASRTESITPVPVTVFDVIDLKLSELLVAISVWLLAWLVLRAQPEAITHQVFALAAALLAANRGAALPSVFGDGEPLRVALTAGHLILSGLVGPALILLAFVFPTPLPRRPRGLIAILFALSAASGLVLAATRLPLLPSETIDLWAYRVMLVILAAGVVALVARLIWSWFRERETRRQRRAILTLLVGLLVALPRIVQFFASLVLGHEVDTFWAGLDLRFLLLAVPISFAYVIIRYQTFEALSPLFIFVLALSTSGALAAVGAWLSQLVQPPGPPAERPPFALLFVFTFLGSFLWSLPLPRLRWLGRRFQWETRTYDAAHLFGRRAMDRVDPRELPAVLTEALVDAMSLERAGLWLRRDDGSLALAGSAGEASRLPATLAGPAREEPFPERTLPGQMAANLPAWLRPLAGEGGAAIIVPLVVAGEPLGLLALGPRWDEALFDARDLVVADLVGQQAALLLRAALQMEELRRVPGHVAEAQERERQRVANELHDTIQQFLGRLPFFLDVSKRNIRTDPQLAADIIDRCLADVEDAAAMLRRIRVSLAPIQLETNLHHSLHGLVSHVRQRSGLDVTLLAPDDLDRALVTETRHALYRVIQQALDNTMSHAGATAAEVTLAQLDGRVTFSVRDNGRGSTPEERAAAQTNGSYGLKSMQARLEMCGGAFALHSAPGAGTTVTGWVPASEA